MFADDSTILWTNKNPADLEVDVNCDLVKIKEWTDANVLFLNVSKTNIITFKCFFNNVTVGDQVINGLNANKFLGVFIDDRLKFEPHLIYLSKKLASNCYAIRIISNNLEFEVAKSAYFSLIESHLRYGICFWGNCSQYLLRTLFVLQKRAIKYLCRTKFRDSCKPLFISNGILTLPCLFLFETCCLMFRKYGSSVNSSSVCNTRQIFNISLPIPSSSQTKNSIIYNSKKIFNHLPLHIRRIQNFKIFRKNVKTLLASKAYYSVNEFFDERYN